jgi:hypothetical protein
MTAMKTPHAQWSMDLSFGGIWLNEITLSNIEPASFFELTFKLQF